SISFQRCIEKNERGFWTIHGLWPSSNKSSPEYCNKTMRYNATVLKPLEQQLDLYWPSVTVSNFNIFWYHEWQKHGTCATMVPQLNGLLNFFNSTLNLYLQHNLTEYLRNSGVVPSSTKPYKLQDIREALLDDIKGAANFVCYNNKNYTAPVLAEIRLCVDRKLQPIDCAYRSSGCGKGNVYYIPHSKDIASPLLPSSTWLLNISWILTISAIPVPLRTLL
ncbi:unnamed protein product, partial [Ixodes hexagonus]